ncbi:MAG TPA: hypothetical protein DCO67_02320 [Staphylococcus sp.]|uniref:hypothetical protein n=1 Tax=Mammaliicoccus TaxID=2803850 RepID=UPI000EDFED95|nr:MULTISPECIES: hypothetical protein [Mammaliicoccus]HAL08783.1 hypothetical protein [Staphylococcus sp.]
MLEIELLTLIGKKIANKNLMNKYIRYANISIAIAKTSLLIFVLSGKNFIVIKVKIRVAITFSPSNNKLDFILNT